MKRIKSNKIVLDNSLFDGYIYFEDGKITDLTVKEYPVSEEYDYTNLYVSAGFIDIHTHGGGGYSFSDELEDVIMGCNFHLAHGTTSICPTVSAAEIEYMARATENIKQAMSDPRVKGTVIGAHLEGPYLSRNQAGAQCADFIGPPRESDYIPVMKKYGDAIARWSYAPENDRDEKFAKALKEYGIVSSAGHTDAVYDDLMRAAKHGCRLITHLYSCTSTITRDHGFRRLGVIETAYLSDDIYVEIICDGKHLPTELIKLIYKIKGANKIALVTDSLPLAGTDRTHGFMQNTEYIIEDGVCKLVDRSAFAGSIATADRLVRVAVNDAEIPLTDAVKMMTATPAKIMNLSQKGTIEQGKDADFAVFDKNINIKSVFVKGKSV